MKTKKPRTYSAHTDQALRLMGQLIKLTRKQKSLSEKELADRVGVSRGTLRKIEQGDHKVEVGLVFEAAAILSIPLFSLEQAQLPEKLAQVQDKLALLPKMIRTKKEVKDDF